MHTTDANIHHLFILFLISSLKLSTSITKEMILFLNEKKNKRNMWFQRELHESCRVPMNILYCHCVFPTK